MGLFSRVLVCFAAFLLGGLGGLVFNGLYFLSLVIPLGEEVMPLGQGTGSLG